MWKDYLGLRWHCIFLNIRKSEMRSISPVIPQKIFKIKIVCANSSTKYANNSCYNNIYAKEWTAILSNPFQVNIEFSAFCVDPEVSSSLKAGNESVEVASSNEVTNWKVAVNFIYTCSGVFCSEYLAKPTCHVPRRLCIKTHMEWNSQLISPKWISKSFNYCTYMLQFNLSCCAFSHLWLRDTILSGWVCIGLNRVLKIPRTVTWVLSSSIISSIRNRKHIKGTCFYSIWKFNGTKIKDETYSYAYEVLETF